MEVEAGGRGGDFIPAIEKEKEHGPPCGPGVGAKSITSAYNLLARTQSQGQPNHREAVKYS